ncbi:sensor domain-containing diguanylate cyclase [Qipengyuania marisflavi]|nr:diguanylate cyclase [Qipengyuania marisflavi]
MDWEQPRHVIRHDLRARPADQPNPQFAQFDRYDFDGLTVIVEGVDGSRASKSFAFDDVRLGSSSLLSVVDLPKIKERAAAVVMVLDGGMYPEVLVTAQLTDSLMARATAGLPHLFAALLCGLLLAPMLFDLGYFRALREPFPLFHALFCIMAFVQTAAVSGLIPLMTNLSFSTELIITYFSLDIMVAATFLFAYNFIEREHLGSWHRKLLIAIAALAIASGVMTTFLPDAFGYWIDHVYFGVYALILAGYFTVLFVAKRRGSRMAPYLIWGFAPLSAIILAQLASVYIPVLGWEFDETWPQNLALLFEVVATALAVANRFIRIRRERDQAMDEARTLGALSERDELTGLLNRRALETRYEALVADGFHAMAVVDLDHFKPINDIYGHPVGDAVIQCAADALAAGSDQDVLAFRIGGEEFLLLLRGKGAAKRAEARRRAITARTLSEMDGFDRPVTASMGFLEFGKVVGQPGIDFTALYSRADQLLYAAKCGGRNRTVEDQLEMFVPEDEDETGSTAFA